MIRHLLALAIFGAAPAAAAAPSAAGSLDTVAIVDTVDADTLPAGTVQRFWFRAGDSQLGQPWLVPVIVVRGAKPGPRLLVTAGIHGDELNGIAVIHELARLEPATLAGTLVLVPGLNTPGLLQSEREWTPDNSRAQPNLNRVMPGEVGGRGIDDYAGRLWSRLLRRNADAAVDLHTQSRGTAYVMYAFASTPRTRRMAELVAPDIIKLDRGEKGTLENELTRAGVPAITLELGRPEVFDDTMIARAGAGLRNLMREMRMLDGAITPLPPETFLSNDITVVRAPVAGFARLSVMLGAAVAQGDRIAVIVDAFGREVAQVTAPRAGRVNTIATDPRRGRGDMLVRIVSWSDDPKCAAGC